MRMLIAIVLSAKADRFSPILIKSWCLQTNEWKLEFFPLPAVSIGFLLYDCDHDLNQAVF